MTSPHTTVTPTTEKPRSGLSAVQVAASALAAVSSAVLLSFLGVAGTLIGAALASVVSTVGAALYSSSLQKTNERLRRRSGRPRPEPATTEIRALPAHLDPRRAPAKRPRVRWARVPVYAAAVFVVAMGVITGVELIGQKPVSAMVTQSSSTGTTLGDLGSGSSSTSGERTGGSTDDTTRNGTTDDSTTEAPASATTTAPATSTDDGSGPTRSTQTQDDEQTTSPASSSAARSSAQPSRSAQPTAPSTAAAPTS